MLPEKTDFNVEGIPKGNPVSGGSLLARSLSAFCRVQKAGPRRDVSPIVVISAGLIRPAGAGRRGYEIRADNMYRERCEEKNLKIFFTACVLLCGSI